jgi:6-methylpretetramide 4-monooxygenase
MTETADVAIVGGGMGGLLLALALARGGRTVTIIERQQTLRPVARGELLQPNGIRILDQLGLLDALKALPVHVSHQFHFHRIGGRKLCTVDYRMLPPPWNYTLITLPHLLLDLILRTLERTDRVRLRFGTEFKELRHDRNRITGIRAEKDGRSIEIRASVVVGSDGAHSRVREALAIPTRMHTYREAYATMVIPRPTGFSSDARYYVGQREILGLFPVSDSELYIFYMIPAEGREKLQQRAMDVMTSAISRIDPSLTGPLRSVTGWNQVGYTPCLRVRADRWTADGAVLMGDAAHAMNPHVAQGRNQAMEDAMILAEVIQEGFNSGPSPEFQLDRYEKTRRPSVERLQKMGDELTRLWNTGLPPLAWFRDRIFEGMERHPQIRKRVVRTISGLDIRPLGLMDRLRVFLP